MGFLLDNFHCTYLQYTSNPFIYFDLNFWQFALNVQIRSFFHEIYFQYLERQRRMIRETCLFLVTDDRRRQRSNRLPTICRPDNACDRLIKSGQPAIVSRLESSPKRRANQSEGSPGV